jgi:hypothetical protein
MNIISFYDLFLKIIKFHHAEEMNSINHYYLAKRHLFYSDQEKYIIDKEPAHLTILNIFGYMNMLASHKEVKIIYKDFPYEETGKEISYSQFWEESRLFYKGMGKTTELPNDPALFFTANISDDVYAKATNTLFNHSIHTNNLAKRLETVKDKLIQTHKEIRVLSRKEINKHIRELYPGISDNEAYIIFRIFKKDESLEEGSVL